MQKSDVIGTAQPVDPILTEVVSNRLFQIILEAGQTLKRVSGAVLTVEAADFAVDLFDAEGNTFVYSPIGLPRQGSAVRLALPIVREHLGEEPGIFPGDIIMTNDPYLAGLHVPDLLLIKPLYFEDELVMWIGVGVHKVDMGGMNPGVAFRATSAYQEGLRIPPVKLVEKGRFRHEIANFYLSNVRARNSQELDLRGQLAATQTVDKRLTELIRRYGKETFKAVVKTLQGYSEQVVRRRLGTIPDGAYEFTDYLDHDGQTDHIYTMKCTLRVEGDSATIDFSGTDPQSPGAINSTLGCTHGAIHAGLLTIIAPDLSPNEGVFKPFSDVIEKGSLLHVQHPTPCSACATEAGYRAQCIFLGAMVKACAAGSDELREMSLSGEWGGSFVWLDLSGQDHAGKEFTTLIFDGAGMGGGARSTKDGFGCSCLHTTVGAMFTNIEAIEREYPVLYLKRGYLTDSPGAGRWRGGSATEQVLMTYDADQLSCGLFHNRRYPPSWGVFGGGPGAGAWLKRKRSTDVFQRFASQVPGFADLAGAEEILPQKVHVDLPRGDVLYYNNPGGGGYGDPLERTPAEVLDDVLDEYITLEAARKFYGVVIDPQRLAVDTAATGALRGDMRRARLQPTTTVQGG